MRLRSAEGVAAFVASALAASASAGLQVDLERAGASLGLGKPPVLAVAACGNIPNLTTCGRIGIAVWLKKPALSVDAELVGAEVRLREGGLFGHGPTYWEGYVRIDRQGLGLPTYWYGSKPVRFLVLHLTIRYPKGAAQGAVRIQLAPGWG